jgi:DNA-binding PadR family transcriptional regulator
VFGLGLIEEPGGRGYRVSPGTLYPMLHSMERTGLLSSRQQETGSHFRRVYRATSLGRKVLRATKVRVRELVGDLFSMALIS